MEGLLQVRVLTGGRKETFQFEGMKRPTDLHFFFLKQQLSPTAVPLKHGGKPGKEIGYYLKVKK